MHIVSLTADLTVGLKRTNVIWADPCKLATTDRSEYANA